MKPILLLLGLFCFAKTFSQDNDIFKRKPWEDFKNEHFRSLPTPQHLPPQLISKGDPAPATGYINTMSVLQLKLSAKKTGSNGMGAIVYNMMPYNMPCLVPDSTFYSNMPIGNFKSNSIHIAE